MFDQKIVKFPDMKFENKEELKARVDKDIASGRQYFKI